MKKSKSLFGIDNKTIDGSNYLYHIW